MTAVEQQAEEVYPRNSGAGVWPGSGPCGHVEFQVDGYRSRCRTCGSFFDRESISDGFVYDRTYPAQRRHFDLAVGMDKVKTLQRWLRQTGMDHELPGLSVCEVGFGGGFCLEYLHRHAKWAWGIEAVAECLEHAVKLGVPRDRLLSAGALPDKMATKIDLWVFQDSFEHLPHPADFMQWVVANSGPRARMLVVAPRAGSVSERLLGRLWPHRLRDHSFHWSREGLAGFLNPFGFRINKGFYPLKWVSLATVLSHMWLKAGLPRPEFRLQVWRLCCLFNMGEMGLLFERRPNI